MITTPPVGSARADVLATHHAIAPSTALQRERRTLYRLAAELLAGDRSSSLDLDVIDSPIARNHIGDALAGRVRFTRSELVGIGALANETNQAGKGTEKLRVVSRPQANTLLAGALSAIGRQLGRQQENGELAALLTETEGERFTSALAVLADGLALARAVSSELVDDLMCHVALIGIIDSQRSGELVSASSRYFPGLVLLTTGSSIDVAEALVHEGAHQKLFDLAITHDLLNVSSDRCPPFHPPWGGRDRAWPIEQTLAAGHAYACLDRFSQDAGVTTGAVAVGPDSLLPVANERSRTIGHWLLDKGDYLGTDAHRLLEGLLGRRPHIAGQVGGHSGALAPSYVVETTLAFRRCDSDRVLVGRPARPPQLYWVSEDAADVLELLKNKPLPELIETLAQRWCTTQVDARDRLATLLPDLSASGLVTAKAC